MRLATWNCHSNLAAKWDAVEALDADVLTIQECGSRTREQVESHAGWSCRWQKGTNRNGLAVLARAPYEIEERDEASAPFFISTVIKGPGPFRCRFVGVWTRSPISDVGDSYPEQMTRVIEQLSNDEIPPVIAGDFNASSRNALHLANVESLKARGSVSAYHTFNRIEHDASWKDATSYHLWRESKPPHMDYVFVPEVWSIENVVVGSFEEYSRRGGMSDHVPIVVTVSPA